MGAPKGPAAVVVPFRDEEDLLDQCLRSILAQTVRPAQVILVDDGSKDRSSRIAEKYVDAYSWRLIRSTGCGPALSRNAALDAIETPFACFLDADDVLAPQAVEELLSCALRRNADIVYGGQAYLDAWGRLKPVPYLERYTRIGESLNLRTVRHSILGIPVATGKLFRRELLDSGPIRFKELRVWEDIPFSLETWLRATRIHALNSYAYIRRPSPRCSPGLSSRNDYEAFQERLRSMAFVDELLESKDLEEERENNRVQSLFCAAAIYASMEKESDKMAAETALLNLVKEQAVQARSFKACMGIPLEDFLAGKELSPEYCRFLYLKERIRTRQRV